MTYNDYNPRKAWLVCLSAGLFFLYVYLQMNIFDVINRPLREAFNINAAELSWLSSTFVWASIVFFIPAGILLDQFSVRKSILITMAVCTLGTLGFALTTSYPLAIIFRALTGVANAFCFLACIVLCYRFFPPNRQALVTGCVVTMAFFGGMVAHTPLAVLTAYIGWRNALLIDTLLGVLIFVWLFLTIKDKEQPKDHPHDRSPLTTKLQQILTNQQNWLGSLYTACMNLPIMVLCALWGTIYLDKVHHLSNIDASNIISLVLIGCMIGGPLFGFGSDHLGRRKPLMLVGAVGLLSSLLILKFGTELPFIALSLVFFSIGLFSSSQVIGYPLISESNRAKNTGLATAIASMIITGSGGVGQVLFGTLLQQHAGIEANHFVSADFQYAITLLPLVSLIACLTLLGLTETYCSRVALDNLKEQV